MRTPSKTALAAVLLPALVLAGCGGASTTPTSTTAANKVVSKVFFTSAAMAGDTIPVRYTCDGSDVSPPLEWGTVPKGTGELVLMVVDFVPEPATANYKVSVEWAVAGINPRLHALAAGRLPPGAYVGLNSDGQRRYSICPTSRLREQYHFELFGLPASGTVGPNFAGLATLKSLYDAPPSALTAHGTFTAVYTRK
jgi:phosphatidylethanolamine-binding protein (PEBP) family uncharacterized protein